MFGPVEPKQTANELVTPLGGESAIVSVVWARFRPRNSWTGTILR
jgi:hypothetical protein